MVTESSKISRRIKEDSYSVYMLFFLYSLPLLPCVRKRKKKKKQPLFEKVARKVYLQEDPGVGVVNQSEFQGKFRM